MGMIDRYEDQVNCVDLSRKVEVYRNLHKDCWSVRQRGIVRFHCSRINLKDCKFVVQPAGHAKVVREKKKNVHAFVRGTVIGEKADYAETFKEKCNVWVTYNPYQNDTFVASVPDPETTFTTFQPVLKANLVTLTQGYVYASL